MCQHCSENSVGFFSSGNLLNSSFLNLFKTIFPHWFLIVGIIRHHPVTFIHISSFQFPLLLTFASFILWRDTAFLFLMARKEGKKRHMTFKPENETGSDAAVQHEQPVLFVWSLTTDCSSLFLTLNPYFPFGCCRSFVLTRQWSFFYGCAKDIEWIPFTSHPSHTWCRHCGSNISLARRACLTSFSENLSQHILGTSHPYLHCYSLCIFLHK